MSVVFTQTYSKEHIAHIQRALNEFSWDVPGRKALVPDGIFGNLSIALLRTCQSLKGDQVTGVYEGKLAQDCEELIRTKFITRAWIIEQCLQVKIEPAMILALMDNESIGAGYLPNSRAKVLFERHQFYKHLRARVDAKTFNELVAKHPTLISTKPGGYLGNEREWDRVDLAMRIHLEAAILSTSWGLGQVMGFNWEVAGAESVMDFFFRMQRSEAKQFELFMGFITRQPSLYRAFQRKDFVTIAVMYNGRNHASNNYVPRMQAAYAKQPQQYKKA